ncbi:hypothetical protein LIER_05863 [Lithospermum erythrorhizon]|uniref:Uncharacterized protein n=1 Tax=Lithospermum erythrorhizon TaxID=34254 RepID=A0AAV3P231_LITER
MELSIAKNKGQASTTHHTTPLKTKYEVKKPDDSTKISNKEDNVLTSNSSEFSFKTKKTEGGLNLGDKRALGIKRDVG